MLEIVSNSGPIIHLAQIGRFDLLDIFSKIFIPKRVYEEISIVDKPGKEELKKAQNIKVVIFFTDDLEARRAAKYLKFDVHGSAGIIALTYKKGLISLEKAKKALNDLYEISSLFITKAIVDMAIGELERFRR